MTLPSGDDTDSRMARRRHLVRRLWVAPEFPLRKDND
jgi:hypothetical protein